MKEDNNVKKILADIYRFSDDKKGENIKVLDVHGLSDITDYFIIVTGNSFPHVNAIAENIRLELGKQDIRPTNPGGERESNWIVLDYFNIIVHVFYKETRDYYNLERLWGDAKELDFYDMK